MNKVHILPAEIVSKIAAGEVIDRPASVVKELLENALDARAQSIELALKQAGRSSICIKDTGTGIEPGDMERIFSRHATSKIKEMDSLYAIQSLGFRGEALYSIAAVSDVCLRSRAGSGDVGWETHLRGGEKLSLKPVSMPQGTEVEIKELFFNTPARRKFLKSDTTELHQILNTFIPYTLLHPGIRFSLTHNGNNLLDLSPEENYPGRIEKALGFKSEYLIQTEKRFPDKGISLRMVLGDINIQRTRRDMQFVFVNSRPVHNYIIAFHLNQVYKLIFPQDVYPFFAVYIDMPWENVDVNIHPSKREVKLRNEKDLISILRAVCEHSLMTYSKAKLVEDVLPVLPHSDSQVRLDVPSDSIETKDRKVAQQYKFSYGEEHAEHAQENRPRSFAYAKLSAGIEDDTFKLKLAAAKYIGPCLGKYLLFEYDDSLLVIDQHAAHERINYEKLLQQIEKGSLEVQRLLTPLVIQISPQEKVIWEAIKDKLETMGLSTTLWDNENIGLHTRPQLIKDPRVALRNLLAEEDSKFLDTDRLARRACRSSVMARDRIAAEEALYLRGELVRCKDPFTCPHGRPTLIELKDNMLEKQFLRK